jgi:hypothetical protein
MKKSKNITLNYSETKQNNLKKRQYKITIPAKMIDYLGWKAKDILKVWINRKKHIEMRKSES